MSNQDVGTGSWANPPPSNAPQQPQPTGSDYRPPGPLSWNVNNPFGFPMPGLPNLGTPQDNQIPSSRNTPPGEWGKPDYFLNQIRNYRGGIPTGPGIPSVSQLPGMMHSNVMGLGQWGSPGVAGPMIQAGMDYNQYTKSFMAGQKARMDLDWERYVHNAQIAADTQQAENREYGEAYATWGPQEDPKTGERGKDIDPAKLEERVREIAQSHNDHVMLNTLATGHLPAAERLIQFREGKAGDVLKQLEIERARLAIEKQEQSNQQNDYYKNIAKKHGLAFPGMEGLPGQQQGQPAAGPTPPESQTEQQSEPSEHDVSPVLPDIDDDGNLIGPKSEAKPQSQQQQTASDATQPTGAGQQVAQADQAPRPQPQQQPSQARPQGAAPEQATPPPTPAGPSFDQRFQPGGRPMAQTPQPPAPAPQPTQQPAPPGTHPPTAGTTHPSGVRVYINPKSMQPDAVASQPGAHDYTRRMVDPQAPNYVGELPKAEGEPSIGLSADRIDNEAREELKHPGRQIGTGEFAPVAWLHNELVAKRVNQIRNYLKAAMSGLQPGVQLNEADKKNIEKMLFKADPDLYGIYHAVRLGHQVLPFTGYAANSPYWNTIRGIMLVADPNYTSVKYENYRRTVFAFESANGYLLQSRAAMNRVMQHMGLAWNLVNQLESNLGTGNVVALNKLKVEFANQLGLPEGTTWKEVGAHVSQELERVFRGTGGSVRSIEREMENLDAGRSPTQLRNLLQADAALLYGQAEALADVWNTGIGAVNENGDPDPTVEGYKDAMHMMSRNARNTFDMLFGTHIVNGQPVPNYPSNTPDPRYTNYNFWKPSLDLNNPDEFNRSPLAAGPDPDKDKHNATTDAYAQQFLTTEERNLINTPQPGDRSMIGQ